jgi:hypothetical protein
MTRYALLAIALLGTACNDPSSDDASKDDARDSKSAKTEAQPTASSTAARPTFKAKMMGLDMSQPLVEVSLAPHMQGYVVTAPEKTRVEVGHGGMGVVLVSAVVNYSMSITEWPFDAAKTKGDFKTLDPDGTVLTDTADLVVFQRKSGGSVLFGMGVSVGDQKFKCHSVATAANFDRATIDQTIESCRSLKRAGAETAASAPPAGSGTTTAAPPSDAPPPGKPVAGAPPAKAKPAPCTCPKGDLMCNMRCNTR